MADHPIQDLMQTAMENLRDMVDVNTIIGDPVEAPDGTVILPISRVGFGFAAGGSEFDAVSPKGQDAAKDSGGGNSLPFGGGAGGGVSITPIGFLVVSHGTVKILSTQSPTQLYDRLLEIAPSVLDRIQAMMGKNGQTTTASGTGGSTNTVM
ncbi:MAG: GerW family sporulation protein [Kyrpidia tusciae]|nr:GerW family sporulation protein [Kyrpidia tusciae]MBE3551317.1 GerW family sporulation protein [Kyrpidia tusciae]